MEINNILNNFELDMTSLLIVKNENDLYNYLDIGIHITNASKYIEYYEKSNFQISTFNGFIDFLFLRKLSYLLNFSNIVIEEKRDKFIEDFKKLDNLFKKYNIGNVIKFINNSFNLIFENKLIASISFDFIKDKLNNIEKCVIKKMVEKHPFILIKNISDLIKYLKINHDIADLLFKEEVLEIYMEVLYKYIFRCVNIFNNHKEFNSIIIKIENYTIKIMEEIENVICQDNAFQYIKKYDDFCVFLKLQKNKLYNSKYKKCSQYYELVQKEIKEKGFKTSLDLNIEEIENCFDKNQPQYDLLQLTHRYIENECIHIFDEIIKSQSDDKRIIDLMHGNLKTNEFFKPSIIIEIQRCSKINSCILEIYLNKSNEHLDNFFNILQNYIYNIFKNIDINFEKLDILNDFTIIKNLYYNFSNQNRYGKNEILIKIFAYSLITYTCAFIEKILREIYVSEANNEMFYEKNKIVLGQLLNEKNDIIVKILGSNLTKCLKYFFIKDENDVGENIRNNFAHLINITSNDYNRNNVYLVMWLLLGMLNSLALYYLKEIE